MKVIINNNFYNIKYMGRNFVFNFWKWSECLWKLFFNTMNQLVVLYTNTFVVNYLACIYSNFTLVITTLIYIFNFNAGLMYKLKLINRWKWEKNKNESDIS